MEKGNKRQDLRKMVIKRLGRLVVLLVLFLGVSGRLSLAALAMEERSSGDWKYVCINNKAYITWYYGSDEKITIPSRLGGYPVVSVGLTGKTAEVFYDRWRFRECNIFRYSDAKTVVIPSSVKYIGRYAFKDLKTLEQIKIPNSVVYIGENAFYNCENLKEIQIPDSVTAIGAQAFCDCEELLKVKLPSRLKIIPSACFWGCSSLKIIEMPGSVIRIEGSAFQYCNSLAVIYYNGPYTKWGKFKVENESDNDTLKYARKVFLVKAAPTISAKTLSLYFNNSRRLTLKGAGSTVKWTSSNSRIATVTSNGTVKALRKGSCVITAATNGYRVTCKVTVHGPVISNKTMSLYINNTKRLTLKGAGKSVKWTSSNTKIASVTSSGTVKARRKGSCVITAATNGSKVTCKVTVTGAKKVTKITCSKEMTMRIGTSETFEYTVLPDNASNKKVKITTSNPSVVQVSSGKLIAKKTGKARITVQATDGSGKKAVCTVTVVKKKKCSSCNGTGRCSSCGGTGKCNSCKGKGYKISNSGRYRECVICLGYGECDICYGLRKCQLCGGEGWW